MSNILKAFLIVTVSAFSAQLAQGNETVGYPPLPGNLLFVDFDSHSKLEENGKATSYRAIDVDEVYSDGSKLFYTEFLRFSGVGLSFGFRTRKSFNCATQDFDFLEVKSFSLVEPQFVDLDEDTKVRLYHGASGPKSNFEVLANTVCKVWDVQNQLANRAIFVNYLRASHVKINQYLLSKYSKDKNDLAYLIDLIGIKYFSAKSKRTHFLVDYLIQTCGEEQKCWDDTWTFVQLMTKIECFGDNNNIPAEISRCPSD